MLKNFHSGLEKVHLLPVTLGLARVSPEPDPPYRRQDSIKPSIENDNLTHLIPNYQFLAGTRTDLARAEDHTTCIACIIHRFRFYQN